MSPMQRYLVAAAGFLGWLFAGVQLGVTSLVMRDAAKSLLSVHGQEGIGEEIIGQWFGWLVASFLMGAALGGYLFGWIGDKMGRKNAMIASILCYSCFFGITNGVDAPWQLLVVRFLTGLGVGGMWPNGIALVSEAWPNMSRPLIAGIIGTAANVGIMLFSLLLCYVFVTPDDWRWVTGLCWVSIVVSLLIAAFVPESPKWLALRTEQSDDNTAQAKSPLIEIFRPPLLRLTLVGICLGTIPLFGGWNNANWANSWASQVGDVEKSGADQSESQEQKQPDPALKARALFSRSSMGSISSLLGAGLAVMLGRRLCYFVLSMACLFCAQYLFWFSHPSQSDFVFWTGALGFFSGFFFGWLPLCLPELFPTRVRSTGAGVSFNFGRIVTVIGILAAASMLGQFFDGDYAQIGRITSWIYAVGMIVIWFAPDTSQNGIED